MNIRFSVVNTLMSAQTWYDASKYQKP